MIFDIKIMSSTRPPCGLTKQEVLNWRVNGLPAVFEGRCQNIYDDAEGVEQKCGKTLGAHPSELAGGKNSFSCSILSPFRLLPFNMFSTRMYIFSSSYHLLFFPKFSHCVSAHQFYLYIPALYVGLYALHYDITHIFPYRGFGITPKVLEVK